MNFTWSSSLCASLSGCVSLIFLSWHAAPSFLGVISPSQICFLCLSLRCQLRESQSSVAAPIWACKYSPRLITKPEHRATGSLSHSLNKVRISGEAVGMVASARPPKTKWDVFVCSSTVRSTIPIGYEWASLWCMTVQRLCVCVRLCVTAQPWLLAAVYYEVNPPGLYIFSLWLMKHLKSRGKDSGYSTQGWLTSLLSARTHDPRRTFSVSLKWD